MKELWLKAQKIAKAEYEEQYGTGSWDYANKFEREDYCMSVYEDLKKENNLTKLNKEDKTMNNKENRMETLKVNGVDVGKYFDVTLPGGSTMRMTLNENGVPVVANDDPILNQIIEDGYVRNTKLHRRWVCAQMFRMLDYKRMNFRNGTSIVVEEGYDACLRNRYSYQYQFDMMLEEIRVISKLEGKDEETFKERTSFFNRGVVALVCEQYMYALKQYINSLPKHKCKGIPYKRIGGRYGDVFESDLRKKVYDPMEWSIRTMRSVHVKNYYDLYRELKKFMKLMIKLPYNTAKSKAWVDAFKGAGAYYTLKNLTMYHGCGIIVEMNQLPYVTKRYAAGVEATNYVKSKLDEYRGQGWRYMAMLKKCIADNNFNFEQRMKEIYNK